MRHKNYYNGRLGFHTRHNDYLPEPYTTFGSPHLEYKRPSMTRVYCKLVQWIADHPNRSRKEVIANVFLGKHTRICYEGWIADPDILDKYKSKYRDRLAKWDNGDFSWVKYNPSRYFAELLWADMIDYDTKTFKYNVAEKGRRLLEEAYLNDNVKKITGKFPWQKSSNV